MFPNSEITRRIPYQVSMSPQLSFFCEEKQGFYTKLSDDVAFHPISRAEANRPTCDVFSAD